MGRMRQGWELTKKSWGVLRTNRELSLFAVTGGVIAFVFTAATVLPGYLLLNEDRTAPGIALIAVGMYVAAFIGIYFNVGLAAAADVALQGGDPSFKQGMAAARQRMGPVAGWALLSVTVKLILSAIQSESGIVGRIVAGLFSVAWNLITFLVVPVIALEGLGPIGALKRSGGLFKQRWGQQITGNIAIGGLVGLLTILPALVLGFLGFMIAFNNGGGSSGDVAAGVALITVAVALLVAGIVIQGAMRGIFGVALYRFAESGEAPGVFNADELQRSVRQKKKS